MGTAIPLLPVHRVDTKEGYPVFNTFTVSREFYVPSHLLSVIGLCYIHLNYRIKHKTHGEMKIYYQARTSAKCTVIINLKVKRTLLSKV